MLCILCICCQVGEWLSMRASDSRLEIDEPVLFPGATSNVPEDAWNDLNNITLRVVTIIVCMLLYTDLKINMEYW